MFSSARQMVDQARIDPLVQKLNDVVEHSAQRQRRGGFAERSWEDSPQVAAICNTLIWAIVVCPFVLVFFGFVRRLITG